MFVECSDDGGYDLGRIFEIGVDDDDVLARTDGERVAYRRAVAFVGGVVHDAHLR